MALSTLAAVFGNRTPPRPAPENGFAWLMRLFNFLRDRPLAAAGCGPSAAYAYGSFTSTSCHRITIPDAGILGRGIPYAGIPLHDSQSFSPSRSPLAQTSLTV